MKLSRLFQPRNPLFWLAVALNALSTLLVWVVQHRELNAWATLLVSGFALGNALIGIWLVWMLLRDEPGGPKSS
jgi:ABC-type iron transport system FetAB permease component